MQTRAKVIVKGEVQRVGYRDEVEKIARKLNIKGFVENLKPYDVRIACEGEEGDVTRFIGALRIEGDLLIRVSDIAVEYEPPTGEFKYFEIKRGSSEEETAERLDFINFLLKNLVNTVSISTIPGEEGEILTVLKSFDAKAGKMVGILGEMNEKLGRIDEKQDRTIEILKDVKEDTKYIPGIKGDTSAGLEKQDTTIGILEDVREDTGEITSALVFLKEIHRETVELREKYELLSRDVDEIKVKLKAG